MIKSNSKGGIGKKNEDFMACREWSDECTLAILADGMGGLSYGDVAARTATEAIAEYIEEYRNLLLPIELLNNAMHRANNAVEGKSHNLMCKMGTAIAVLFVKDRRAYYTWLGNVRIYLSEDYSKLTQLTKDHIYIPNAKNKSTYLTRCIKGKEFREEPPFGMITLTPNSHLLLCSDGLYQELFDEDLLLYEGVNAGNYIENPSDDSSIIEFIY